MEGGEGVSRNWTQSGEWQRCVFLSPLMIPADVCGCLLQRKQCLLIDRWKLNVLPQAEGLWCSPPRRNTPSHSAKKRSLSHTPYYMLVDSHMNELEGDRGCLKMNSLHSFFKKTHQGWFWGPWTLSRQISMGSLCLWNKPERTGKHMDKWFVSGQKK
jgi:hypothetical protein